MEVTRAIGHCRFYAKNMGDYLNPTLVKTEAKKKTLIKYEPLGVIYYIIPFNYPFWLSFKGALATMLLGNAIIMRPADSTPLVGEAVQQIFEKAGLDGGQLQTVYTSQEQLDRIMSNPLVGGVAFTGSTNAGGKIAEIAGKNIKKSVMELGGNDPFIVLEDADIEQAAKDAVRGRCANSGQVCFSPKRFILVGRTYEAFKHKLIENLQKTVIGDPMDEKTTLGPIAREDLYENLDRQLKKIPDNWKIVWQSDAKKPFYPITVI
jgi:succinate-semialdehyde dehydrogenase/glutarate-semialdehyde dehydrogenase